jgi:aryl-alcohol dehydrogenase-like predicted oxidoreductase
MNNAAPENMKEILRKFWLENANSRIPFGMGCAWLGKGYPDRNEVRERLLTFETAYELGFRYYDTARAYGDSEWVVGEFVPSVPRGSIFLATKFHLPKVEDPRLAAEQSMETLSESLRRLKTDYLDLYQVHDSTNLAIVFAAGGVLDSLLEEKRQGLIRAIGMAIRSQDILKRALDNEAFDTILTWGEYSPFNQSAGALIERATRQKVGVINASPLYEARQRGLDFSDPRVLAAVLQFPIRNPGIDVTLTGPSNPDEIRATVRALHETVDRGLWEEWKKGP